MRRYDRHPVRCLFMLVLVGTLSSLAAAQQLPVRPQLPDQPLTRDPNQSAPEGPQVASLGAQLAQHDVPIGSGDLVEVSVYGAKDFDKQVRVAEDGNISLPLLGKVRIGGMTSSQAEQRLAKLLTDGQYFNNPQVSVFVFSTQGVSVLGEVQKPGIYPLLGHRAVLDAISAAGGTTLRAGKTVTIMHADRNKLPEKIALSYGPGGMTSGNASVSPGDTVIVSQAGVVYVVGDVRMPSGIVMNTPRMTVLQAIAMAQGTNPAAALNDAKLIRTTPSGRRQFDVRLKAVLAAKAPDIELQAGDILFVPSSAVHSAARRGLDAAIQAAIGVAIYRP